jgi:hypothetical protein
VLLIPALFTGQPENLDWVRLGFISNYVIIDSVKSSRPDMYNNNFINVVLLLIKNKTSIIIFKIIKLILF